MIPFVGVEEGTSCWRQRQRPIQRSGRRGSRTSATNRFVLPSFPYPDAPGSTVLSCPLQKSLLGPLGHGLSVTAIDHVESRSRRSAIDVGRRRRRGGSGGFPIREGRRRGPSIDRGSPPQYKGRGSDVAPRHYRLVADPHPSTAARSYQWRHRHECLVLALARPATSGAFRVQGTGEFVDVRRFGGVGGRVNDGAAPTSDDTARRSRYDDATSFASVVVAVV